MGYLCVDNHGIVTLQPRNINLRCPLKKFIMAGTYDHDIGHGGNNFDDRKYRVNTRYMVISCFHVRLYHDCYQVYRSLNVFLCTLFKYYDLVSVDFGANLAGKSPECQNVFFFDILINTLNSYISGRPKHSSDRLRRVKYMCGRLNSIPQLSDRTSDYFR